MSFAEESSDKSGFSNDTFSAQRQELVDRQLRERGIEDDRVLSALRTVPREEFLPDALRDAAYKDRALPIGHGQTISQPYTVAFMCQALELTGSERVLDVGTGSGYAAAVLSHLAREVHSIEVVPELAEQARERFLRLGYTNVTVTTGDGSQGLPEYAPFDAIVVAAAADAMPRPYADQLREGGRVVIPLRSGTHQVMYRFTLLGRKLHLERLGDFVFVPLVGKFGGKPHREPRSAE